MAECTLIAVDIAKSVFQIVVLTGSRRVDYRVRRPEFLAFFVDRPPALVFMEACGSAHAWARQIQALGHEVRLLPPHYVRPFVRRNKTDRTDAHGILDAGRQADIQWVPIKSVDQQILTSLHRLRSGWIAERTARINALRGLLRELGFIIPVGAERVIPHVHAIIGDPDNDLPTALRTQFQIACTEVRDIEQRIEGTTRRIEALAQDNAVVTRLCTVPGIGLITSTALLAFVGDVQRFPTGRRFASFLGLTPREHSSGLRHLRGGISKRGDSYLRTLLIHGARSALLGAQRTRTPDHLRTWALTLRTRHGHNVAAVALANKLARIAWAVWRSEREFISAPAPTPA